MDNQTYIVEKLKEHDKKFDEHDKKFDEQDDKIKDLSIDGREYKIQIQNLCREVENLVNIMKWFIGILITSLVGFFFFAIQNGLFGK